MNDALLITLFGPLYGVDQQSIIQGDSTYKSLQPLLPLFKMTNYNNKAAFIENLKVGSTIIFLGDPLYPSIHPAGVNAAHNCFVSSKTPLRVRIFGKKNELSEDDLYQFHITDYQEEPTQESNIISGYTNLALRAQHPTTSKEKIRGFYLNIIEFNDEILEHILTSPIEVVIQFYEKLIQKNRSEINKAKNQDRAGNTKPLFNIADIFSTPPTLAKHTLPAFQEHKKLEASNQLKPIQKNQPNEDLGWFKSGSLRGKKLY